MLLDFVCDLFFKVKFKIKVEFWQIAQYFKSLDIACTGMEYVILLLAYKNVAMGFLFPWVLFHIAHFVTLYVGYYVSHCRYYT